MGGDQGATPFPWPKFPDGLASSVLADGK